MNDRNIYEAIGNSWEHEENHPIGWIEKENGELTITTTGPERFDNPGDIYKIKLSLIDCLAKYGEACEGDEPDDRKDRALMLRDLAKRVLEIADKLE